MTYEIYSYWDTTIFFKVFQGISLVLNDGSYYGLLVIGVTVGTFFAIFSNMIGKATPVDSLKHVIYGAFMFWILIIPRSTVTIIDKSFLTQTSAPMTISNIPTSLAFIASIFTHVGVWADDLEQTVLGLPSEMHAAGTHMTRKVLIGTVLAEPNNALFLHNVTEYTRECVVYDLTTGYKNMDDIQNASDTWGALGDTNPAILVTLSEMSAGKVVNKTYNCLEAYQKLSTDKDAISTQVEQRLAGSNFPGMTQAAAQAAYSALLTESMSSFMNESTKTAEQMFQNSVSQNAFLHAIGDVTGNPVSMAKAVVGIDAGATQKKELAKSFIYTITVVELLVYAFFPFAVMLIIFSGPNGLKGLFMIVKIMAWLALVQVSQVIIDNIILMNTASETTKEVSAFGPSSINAWFNAGGIINGMDDQLQNALFASLALSWAMVSAMSSFGSGMVSGLFGGAQTYNERTAIDIAAEGKNTFGDSRWNNSNHDNTAAYSHVTSPNVDSGNFAFRSMEGGIGRIAANGHGSYHGGEANNSGLPAKAQVMSELSQSHRRESARATEQASIYSANSTMALGSAVSRLASHSKDGTVGGAFSTKQGSVLSSDSSKVWEQSAQAAHKVMEDFKIKDSALEAKLTSAYASGKVSAGLSTMFGGLAVEAGLKKEDQNKFETAVENGQQVASEGVTAEQQRNAVSEIKKALTDSSFVTDAKVGTTDREAIANDVKHSEEFQHKSEEQLKHARAEKEASDRINSLKDSKSFDLVDVQNPGMAMALERTMQKHDFKAANSIMDEMIAQYELSKGFRTPTQVQNGNLDERHKNRSRDVALASTEKQAALPGSEGMPDVHGNIQAIESGVGAGAAGVHAQQQETQQEVNNGKKPVSKGPDVHNVHQKVEDGLDGGRDMYHKKNKSKIPDVDTGGFGGA